MGKGMTHPLRPDETHEPDWVKTLYITRWAVSRGIMKRKCSWWRNMPDRVVDDLTQGVYWSSDWHKTLEDALARCEELRTMQIDSLRRRLAKISSLAFKVVEEE